jgi:hypothetical protein
MRAYSVVFTPEGELKNVVFIGSDAEAKTFRGEVMKIYDLKRKDIEINLVEIPTTKPELIAWLNAELKK